MEEEKIISLIRERDERGEEELLRCYGPLMRYVIAPILPDEHDREECLSEAALRVWERIGQYDSARGSWTAWLTAIARNAARNRLRGAWYAAQTGEIPPDHPAPGLTPEEEMLQRERQEELKRALGRLRAGERILFYRKYYYMQSTEQIAAELGLTTRAVEGRLYRIRGKLRRLLGGETHD
ncbi:MAG: sigma-70 family RNA polymerase sigma factor [Lachnospiraceae bacterium]|nr:sigma-70 family RNA polymerase sigma factor [Lachnospiraceae bacterium]